MKKKIIAIVIIIVLLIGGLSLFLIFKPKTHKVEFINDKDIKIVKVNNGELVNCPSDPTKDGYEFLGWYKDKKVFDFNTKITSDIKLVATWKEIVKNADKDKHTVTFKSDDKIISQKTVDKDKSVSEPRTPNKEGYTFSGWYNKDKKYDFNSKVTEDLELDAKWDKADSNKKEVRYDVVFDSDGGSKVEAKSVLENDVVVKPTNPTKEGYIFASWQLDGKDYDFSTKVTKNITLKAHWIKSEIKKLYTYSWDYLDKATPIDVKVTIYEDGKKVDIKGIYRAKDGKKICGSSAIMNKIYVKDVTELLVELLDGSKVKVVKK